MLQDIWYVVPNDLVGGWSIATVNKPMSQQNQLLRRVFIADVASKALGEHIVALHNTSREVRTRPVRKERI